MVSWLAIYPVYYLMYTVIIKSLNATNFKSYCEYYAKYIGVCQNLLTVRFEVRRADISQNSFKISRKGKYILVFVK